VNNLEKNNRNLSCEAVTDHLLHDWWNILERDAI